MYPPTDRVIHRVRSLLLATFLLGIIRILRLLHGTARRRLSLRSEAFLYDSLNCYSSSAEGLLL